MLFNHPYRYVFVVLLAAYTYFNTLLCGVYAYFDLNVDWYYSFGAILIITLAGCETGRLLNPFAERRINRTGKVFKVQVLAMLISMILGAVATVLTVLLVHDIILKSSTPLQVPLKLTLTYNSLVVLLFHLLNAVGYYSARLKEKEVEAQKLQTMNMQAQLQVMHYQINPHFLFNNMNVLSGLVLKNNPEQANHFIEEFSRVYQYILSNKDREVVLLDAELEFLRSYIYLLEQRFGDSIRIETTVPARYNTYYIVPAALQILVENALKHNIASPQKPLHITIYANGREVISVINNKQPKTAPERSFHIGLNNINQRYSIISGQNIQIENGERDFSVTLPLLKIDAA
jgi:two-component system, LytTR family, sensor kinase